MKTVFYHYPRCGTCRRARALIDRIGADVVSIDLVAEPPSVERLGEILDRSSLDLKRLFNVSGRSYREGGFKDRLSAMTRAEALEALARDGKLIKRPILLTDRVAIVGFDEAAYAEALEGA